MAKRRRARRARGVRRRTGARRRPVGRRRMLGTRGKRIGRRTGRRLHFPLLSPAQHARTIARSTWGARVFNRMIDYPLWVNWGRAFKNRGTQMLMGAAAASVLGKRSRAGTMKMMQTPTRGDVIMRPAGYPSGINLRPGTSTFRPRKRRIRHGPGKFVGRFPHPNKVKALDKYALFGARTTHESYGTVTHKDCGYAGLMNATITPIGEAVGVALLRYIMKKHHEVEYTDQNNIVVNPHDAPGALSELPHQIIFYAESVNATGLVSDIAFKVGYLLQSGASTVRQFGAWFSTNVFSSVDFNHHDAATGQYSRLRGYRLLYHDVDTAGGATTVNRISNLHRLDNVKIHVYQYNKIAVQNTTPGDGGGLTTDAIDANPIQGRLFKFSDLVPDTRDTFEVSGYTDLENDIANAPGDGMIIPNVNPSISWRGIPDHTAFRNCIGYSKVFLQPGEIKNYKFAFNYIGTIDKLMRGLWFGSNKRVHSALSTTHRMGQSLLFALEKVVRTGVQDDVVFNWHLDREVGCYIGKKTRTVMRKDFSLNTYNVNPTDQE